VLASARSNEKAREHEEVIQEDLLRIQKDLVEAIKLK
jgi:hypothetical protein